LLSSYIFKFVLLHLQSCYSLGNKPKNEIYTIDFVDNVDYKAKKCQRKLLSLRHDSLLFSATESKYTWQSSAKVETDMPSGE